MYLKRQRQILRIISSNPHNSVSLAFPLLQRVEAQAHSQLSLPKLSAREIDYFCIELFLVLAPHPRIIAFYIKLAGSLHLIFNDEKVLSALQKKWTQGLKNNIIAIFNRIAKDYFKFKECKHFSQLYSDIIMRLLTQETISRVQSKFLQPFLVHITANSLALSQILHSTDIYRQSLILSKSMSENEPPKALSNDQFLKYCIFRSLNISLPHQKSLYSQLLRSPNPKFLLAFQKKGTFTALTSEMLSKSNKLTMNSIRYWCLFEYEDEIYEKTRTAAQWENKAEILFTIMKRKINTGLDKYLNLLDKKVSSSLSENQINILVSYVEICLNICKNSPDIETSLQKIDITHAFQNIKLISNPQSKGFLAKFIQLYFILLDHCSRPTLKLKFLQHIAINIVKVLQIHKDQKFTQQITDTSLLRLKKLSEEERRQYFYAILEFVNREWESDQELIINTEIAKIDPHTINYLSNIVAEYGFDDFDKTRLKILKLQFFYILSLSYKSSELFEAKKKFSRVTLDISTTLFNNTIFSIFETRGKSQLMFRNYLRTLYGQYEGSNEMEGILAVVDEIVTYRIQDIAEIKKESFFCVLVNFLEQISRYASILPVIRKYFIKCKKTYMIELISMKFKDETKTHARTVITSDVCFLVEGCLAANPFIASFCQEILHQYITLVPELAVYSHILVVFAQCISVLHKKCSKEYESKAEKLRGKFLTSGLLIPTNNKDIQIRLIILMQFLYSILMRGYCIDDDYLKVRTQYLIRQHCKSANFTFGWKYLKHVVSNFKEDKQFISKEILMNNSCSWFINEDYFAERIEKVKAEKIVLDVNLWKIHHRECNQDSLKKLLLGVEPQIQTQFVTIPTKNDRDQLGEIIREMETICAQIQAVESEAQERKIQADEILERTKENNLEQDELETLQNSLYDAISRVKMIYIDKTNHSQVFGRILDVCKKHMNPNLLKHILLKIVPFFYCVNEFNPKIISLIAEMLHYIVQELNASCRLSVQRQTKNNIFNIGFNCFEEIDEIHREEADFKESKKIRKQTEKKNFSAHSFSNSRFMESEDLIDSNNSIQANTEFKINASPRFSLLKSHERKLHNLKHMHESILKFLTRHMHVCLAKAYPLTLIIQIFSINFLINREVLQLLPLESICYCLNSQLELVNVLKSSIEKGETIFQESLIDEFYFKTLKMGLYHFQKNRTFYEEELLNQTHKSKELRNKINYFIQICDYLRNDDFHRLIKRKLPKKNEIFLKARESNPLRSIFSNKRDKITEEQSTVQYYDITVLRYTLLYMISEQIDRTKAYASPQLMEVKNPYSLTGKLKFISLEQIQKLIKYLGVRSSIVLVYNITKMFGNRIECYEQIVQQLTLNLSEMPIYDYPHLLTLYIDHNRKDPTKINEIYYWKVPNIQIILKYLQEQYENYPSLQLYACRVLSQAQPEQLLFYLPQIFQALTLKTGQIIFRFLLDYAKKSACFAHQLIWIAKVQSKQEQDPHNKNKRLEGVDGRLQILKGMAKSIVRNVIKHFTRQEKQFFREVDQFYEQVTAISGKMQPKMPSSQKKEIIRSEILKIKVPKSVYLPINPIYRVISINNDSGTPMQSAAKCPFLLTFNCVKYIGPDKDFEERKLKKRETIRSEEIIESFDEENPDAKSARKMQLSSVVVAHNPFLKPIKSGLSKIKQIDIQDINIIDNLKVEQLGTKNVLPYRVSSFANLKSNPKLNFSEDSQNKSIQVSCIFKVFDDIRQDCLALQIIKLFMQIYERHDLPLKLFPYKTISNRTGSSLDIGGIIEVVPKTVSRDSIGKTNEESLYEFFINNFGAEHQINFQGARENFIKSQAAYSIISYILQIKDRHNGNILINKEKGYLVHIDFGFIFDISPANNLRFERANFKLTEEMIKIMGGSIESQPFQLYLSLVIKGFLITRKYYDHIMNVVKRMFKSGLPCFLEDSLTNLASRFVLNMNEIEAAEHMKNIVMGSVDHWTTNWYDRIQWMQQKIYH